jgi:heptosyltransferase II
VCRAGLGNLFLELNLVDEVIEVKKGHRGSYLEAKNKLLRYDLELVVSAHQSIRTGLFVRSLKAKKSVGYKTALSFLFYDSCINYKKEFPDVLRQMALSESIDQYQKMQFFETDLVGKVAAFPPELSISQKPKILSHQIAWRRFAEQKQIANLDLNKVILVFPGSVWSTKRWISSGFVDISRKLIKKNYQIILMGSLNEKSLCEEIKNQVPGVLSLAGETSIFESCMLMARSVCVVANDSGAIHLAALCETTTVALFGPTVLAQGFRPWASRSFVAQLKDLKCRPCGPHGHHQCPLGTHECMKELSSEQVYQTVTSAIKQD